MAYDRDMRKWDANKMQRNKFTQETILQMVSRAAISTLSSFRMHNRNTNHPVCVHITHTFTTNEKKKKKFIE